MANWQTKLQPMLKSTGASQDQEVRFAVPTRGAITVVPWINVLANASSSAPVVRFYGANSLDLNPDLAQTVSFWPTLSTIITVTANQPGAYTGAAFTYVPPYIRWGVSSVTGSFTFEIILLCWDGVGTPAFDGVSPSAFDQIPTQAPKLSLNRETIARLNGFPGMAPEDDVMYKKKNPWPKATAVSFCATKCAYCGPTYEMSACATLCVTGCAGSRFECCA